MQPSCLQIDTALLLLEGVRDSHLGFCLCDPSDRVQFVNHRFRQAFFPSAPTSSFDFVDAIAAAIAAGTGISLDTMPLEDFIPKVRDRRRNGPARFDFHVDLSDGAWWRVSDHRLDNGWILAVAIDITATKREELELRAAHAAALEETRTDALTGLQSRKFGLDCAEKALIEHRLAPSPLCFGIVDIDHFKQVNDRYGHQVGDNVLKHFADALRVGLGPRDQITRLGGEEFLIVMPNTPAELAQLKMQRLALSIRPLPGSATHPPVHVTFSAGLAPANVEEGISATLTRADAALYEAKQNGRNSVRLAADARAVDAA